LRFYREYLKQKKNREENMKSISMELKESQESFTGLGGMQSIEQEYENKRTII
jgi:hypothetical protein